MNKNNGKLITSDLDHLRQSIEDILTTPLGARVMRRDYGSRLFDLIDSPAQNVIDFYAATAEAIERWEPRFALKDVAIDIADAKKGQINLTLRGVYRASGEAINFNVKVAK